MRFQRTLIAAAVAVAPAACIAMLMVASAAAAQQPALEDAADLVTAAIAKCRVRLEDKPHDVPFAFPRTQYRLALLLESRLSPAAENAERVEIAQLYAASALNETHGFDIVSRIQALTKAAAFMVDVGDEESSLAAEDMLQAAIDISGEDVDEADPHLLQSARAAAVETYVQLLLAGTSGDGEKAQLERALDLCRRCSELAPMEPVCDEYRGVVLRRLYKTRAGRSFKSSILSPSVSDTANMNDESKPPSSAAKDVHDAYASAAKKSHEAAVVASLTPEALGMSRYPCGTLRFKYAGKKFPTSNQLTQPTEADTAFLSSLWTRLVRHIVLAAAAAREAGLRDEEDKHLSYGLSIVSHLTVGEYARADVQADLLTNAGIRHKVRGETKEAIRYFRAALEVNPNDGHALVQLASLGDKDAASTTELSDDYVAGLFDGYSERFEKELIEDLGYRGHEIVANGIVRHWEGNDGSDEIAVLDIGCGTGLLGALLREKLSAQDDATCTSHEAMQELVIRGIDLSERMVEISRARTISGTNGDVMSVYDSVHATDAASFLQSMDSSSINIITASDVFIYIGALDSVFMECSRVLIKGGLLGFTVEIPPDNEGLVLLKSGRFGHSKTYVQELAERVGLSMVEWKDEVLRKQGKDYVAGAVVTLQLL